MPIAFKIIVDFDIPQLLYIKETVPTFISEEPSIMEKFLMIIRSILRTLILILLIFFHLISFFLVSLSVNHYFFSLLLYS